jgi:hypothetical protein
MSQAALTEEVRGPRRREYRRHRRSRPRRCSLTLRTRDPSTRAPTCRSNSSNRHSHGSPLSSKHHIISRQRTSINISSITTASHKRPRRPCGARLINNNNSSSSSSDSTNTTIIITSNTATRWRRRTLHSSSRHRTRARRRTHRHASTLQRSTSRSTCPPRPGLEARCRRCTRDRQARPLIHRWSMPVATRRQPSRRWDHRAT